MRQLTPHRPPKTDAGRPLRAPGVGLADPAKDHRPSGLYPTSQPRETPRAGGLAPDSRQPEDCGMPAHFLQNGPRGKSITASRSPEALREDFPVRGSQKPGNLAASSIAWLYPVFCLKLESPP